MCFDFQLTIDFVFVDANESFCIVHMIHKKRSEIENFILRKDVPFENKIL